MQTPTTNFRYRGVRESRKLVLQSTAALADLAAVLVGTLQIESDYTTSIPANFSNLDEDYQSSLQRARVVADFVRSVTC